MTDTATQRQADYERGIEEMERRSVPFPSPPVEFVRIIGEQAREIERLREAVQLIRDARRRYGLVEVYHKARAWQTLERMVDDALAAPQDGETT